MQKVFETWAHCKSGIPIVLLRCSGCAVAVSCSSYATVVFVNYISFSKRTWLGQKITTTLQMRGILTEEIMEIDSLDAIEDLVTQGFGVSIVPKRLLAESVQSTLTQIPFGDPVEGRNLVLIERRDSSQPSIDKFVHSIFSRLALLSLTN